MFLAGSTLAAAQGGITIQGQEQRQGYNSPFTMVLIYHGPGNISYRTSTADGNIAMASRQ